MSRLGMEKQNLGVRTVCRDKIFTCPEKGTAGGVAEAVELGCSNCGRSIPSKLKALRLGSLAMKDNLLTNCTAATQPSVVHVEVGGGSDYM